jgi:pimeloyl-ACP methyl ester carboxylesterase/DNA-binding winged helix-turn-helix (wHTH) protein/class 3 adenylate cyclase
MNGKKLYEFGRFKLDAEERLLFDGASSIQLPPKIFDTLLMLVENAGRSVEKDAMMRQIWSDSFVEENNLAQNISILRKTLGDVGFIETVPKRGYRFAAQVRIIEDAPNRFVAERTSFRARETNNFEEEKRRRGEGEIESIGSKGSFSPFSASLELAPAKPETHYAQNGDVNIAYQVVGDGDLDVVFVMGWVSHLEYFWEETHFAAFLNRLASFSRLILFDKRGTGLSDRVPVNELPTLEQRMEDVHAVMDAVGSERAALIGVSEGGPMCSLFAATYPERTLALTMIGTYAKRIWAEDYPWAPTAEQRERFYELMRRDWGKPVGIEDRAPSLAGDEHFRNWWATYLRMGASPGAALALTKMNAEIDVRHVLPTIQVPTLVIHRSGDACLKVEEGRFVASQIPGCKYVELPGVDHLPFVGNQEEILEEIEEFLTGVRYAPEYDSVLATVMQLRIVNPAQQAETFGRERWENIVSRSANFVRHQIQLFKGREVSYDERGVLATFDGPARAVRCAQAISHSAQRLGISVKTGLHTGECDLIGEKVGGVAVRLAEAVAEEAAVGEILVSRTVKDLVAGSGLQFQEYSVKSFANLPGEWRLFAVKG